MFQSTLLIFVVKLKKRKREREILGKNSHDNSEFILNFNIYFGIKKKKKRIAQPISIVKNLFNKIISPLLLHSLPFIISSFPFSFHKLLSTFFFPSSTSFSPFALIPCTTVARHLVTTRFVAREMRVSHVDVLSSLFVPESRRVHLFSFFLKDR